jgi:hypothetical protein
MNGRFTNVVLMASHVDAGESLLDFMYDVGIPKMLMRGRMVQVKLLLGILTLFNMCGGCGSSYTLQNREGRIKIMQQNERLVAWQSLGSYKCRRKRYRHDCGIMVLYMKVNYCPECLVVKMVGLCMKWQQEILPISANGLTLNSMILFGGLIGQIN